MAVWARIIALPQSQIKGLAAGIERIHSTELNARRRKITNMDAYAELLCERPMY